MKSMAAVPGFMPRRIVSLAPSVTEILCALGAGSRLVGVTRWCKDVAPVDGCTRLPAVRNRKIYVISDELLNTPSPILVHGADALAAVLHPAIFAPPLNGNVRRLAEEV